MSSIFPDRLEWARIHSDAAQVAGNNFVVSWGHRTVAIIEKNVPILGTILAIIDVLREKTLDLFSTTPPPPQGSLSQSGIDCKKEVEKPKTNAFVSIHPRKIESTEDNDQKVQTERVEGDQKLGPEVQLPESRDQKNDRLLRELKLGSRYICGIFCLPIVDSEGFYKALNLAKQIVGDPQKEQEAFDYCFLLAETEAEPITFSKDCLDENTKMSEGELKCEIERCCIKFRKINSKQDPYRSGKEKERHPKYDPLLKLRMDLESIAKKARKYGLNKPKDKNDKDIICELAQQLEEKITYYSDE